MNNINLNIYITKIIEALPKKSVKYIFMIGSFARNENNIDSDIDLIVVSDYLKKINSYLRTKIILTNFDNMVPKADITCMSEQEFNKYKKSKAYKNETIKLIFKEEI